MTYDPTPKQEQAIREWLQEAIVPLIEQVLVKKLGQAMSFAKQEVIAQASKPWVGLTDEQIIQIASTPDGSQATTKGYVIPFARAIEAKLKEKNA